MCTDCNEITIPVGPTGPTGPQGPAGTNGTNGTNGTTILAAYNNLIGVGVPNSLVETSLFSYTIPANTIGTNNSELELYTYFEYNPDAFIPNNIAFFRIKLGSKIHTTQLTSGNACIGIIKLKISRISSTSELWTLDRLFFDTVTNITSVSVVELDSSTVDLTTNLVFEITGQNQTASLNQVVLKKATLYKYSI